jgi:hypothetical protein
LDIPTSPVSQVLDHIESPMFILFYFSFNIFPDLFHALKDTFREIKLARVSFVLPSLIACELHGVLALKRRNLVVKAMLSTIKDSDKALTGLLPGRLCIYKMTRRCLIGEILGPFYPDIAFNH